MIKDSVFNVVLGKKRSNSKEKQMDTEMPFFLRTRICVAVTGWRQRKTRYQGGQKEGSPEAKGMGFIGASERVRE